MNDQSLLQQNEMGDWSEYIPGRILISICTTKQRESENEKNKWMQDIRHFVQQAHIRLKSK